MKTHPLGLAQATLPLLALAPFAAAILAAPVRAQPQEGDPEAGGRIARTWCTECHAVEPEAPVSDVAPGFESLARERTPSQLAAFLTRPHGLMPPLALSRREIEDLVAYIRSLPAR